MKKNCKKFYKLLKKTQFLNTEVYTLDWFFTIYTRAFSINVARAIWDIYLIFGDFYMLQIGVRLFALVSKELSEDNLAEGLSVIRVRSNALKLSQLVSGILNVDVSQHKFDDSLVKEILKLRKKAEEAKQLQDAVEQAEKDDGNIEIKNNDSGHANA